MNSIEELSQRWDALVEQLSAHPDVTLVHAERRKPAGEDWIADAHAMWKIPVDPAFDAFYRFADGVRLRWTVEHEGTTFIGGDANFPRLSELDGPEFWPVSSDTFEGLIRVGGTRLSPVLAANFWEWSQDSIDAALLVPGDALRVTTTCDYCADVSSSALVGFGDYIDLLFGSYFSRYLPTALRVAQRRAPLARDAAPSMFERTHALDDLVALTRREPSLAEAGAFFATELG